MGQELELAGGACGLSGSRPSKVGGQWAEGWAFSGVIFFTVVDLGTRELEMSCSNGFYTYLQWSF